MNHQAARRLYRRAHGEQAVILQDQRLPVAQRLRQPHALALVQHHARERIEQRMILVEGARVLRQRIEQASERRERLAVGAVRVRGRDHVRPRRVDRGMNGEAGRVDRPVAGQDVAFVIDELQVRHADLAEMLRQRIDPELLGKLRIARGDVSRQALVEAVACEQAEGGGETLLAVQGFLLERGCRRPFLQLERARPGDGVGVHGRMSLMGSVALDRNHHVRQPVAAGGGSGAVTSSVAKPSPRPNRARLRAELVDDHQPRHGQAAAEIRASCSTSARTRGSRSRP